MYNIYINSHHYLAPNRLCEAHFFDLAAPRNISLKTEYHLTSLYFRMHLRPTGYIVHRNFHNVTNYNRLGEVKKSSQKEKDGWFQRLLRHKRLMSQSKWQNYFRDTVSIFPLTNPYSFLQGRVKAEVILKNAVGFCNTTSVTTLSAFYKFIYYFLFLARSNHLVKE